jgi:hypothetical protein
MKCTILIRQLLISAVLFILPGCTPMIEWGKHTFYQGDSLEKKTDRAQSYIRSVNAYDQFATIARFDALWLSPEVRNLYIDLVARTGGKNDDQKKVLLNRQQDELKHFITFYILSPYDITLGENSSRWGLFLSIDGVPHNPIEIKIVELSPIYSSFFADRQMRFCASYQVKFDALDPQNQPIVTDATKELTLYFRSLEKELKLSWSLADFTIEEKIPPVTDTTSGTQDAAIKN